MRRQVTCSILCALMTLACNKAPSDAAKTTDKKNSPSANTEKPAAEKSKPAKGKVPAKVSTVNAKSAAFELRLVRQDDKGQQFSSWSDDKAYYLDPKPIVGLADIKSAKVGEDNLGKSFLSVELKESGATRLQKQTEQSVGRQLAFIVQGKVLNAPVIKEKIGGGSLNVQLGKLTASDLKLDEFVKMVKTAPVK